MRVSPAFHTILCLVITMLISVNILEVKLLRSRVAILQQWMSMLIGNWVHSKFFDKREIVVSRMIFTLHMTYR